MTMRMKNHIAKYCDDPSNPFQVKAELMVRKMLEKHTGWEFEFIRNDLQYGVDIIAYKYTLNGNKFIKNEMGRIEVEASKQWVNGEYPKHWKFYSYLRRKVEQWDKSMSTAPKGTSIWMGRPWPSNNRVIYVKCALDMSDCHSALVSDIWVLGKTYLVEDKSISLPESQRWYYRTHIILDRITIKGWEKTIGFAIQTFDT